MHHLRRLWLLLLAISFLTPARGTDVGEGVIQGVVLKVLLSQFFWRRTGGPVALRAAAPLGFN
jgi:hypothetical protein